MLIFSTVFYLYTNKSVKSVVIKINDEGDTLEMTKIKTLKEETGFLWVAKRTHENSCNGDIKYKYMPERKHKSSTLFDTVRHTRFGSTNYDSFSEKDECSLFTEQATICYSKWLFETVDEQNFRLHATEINKMNFKFQQLDSKDLKTFVAWIFEQETKDSVTKCLYLGVLLALVDQSNSFDWQKKIEEKKCRQFVDIFLTSYDRRKHVLCGLTSIKS